MKNINETKLSKFFNLYFDISNNFFNKFYNDLEHLPTNLNKEKSDDIYNSNPDRSNVYYGFEGLGKTTQMFQDIINLKEKSTSIFLTNSYYQMDNKYNQFVNFLERTNKQNYDIDYKKIYSKNELTKRFIHNNNKDIENILNDKETNVSLSIFIHENNKLNEINYDTFEHDIDKINIDNSEYYESKKLLEKVISNIGSYFENKKIETNFTKLLNFSTFGKTKGLLLLFKVNKELDNSITLSNYKLKTKRNNEIKFYEIDKNINPEILYKINDHISTLYSNNYNDITHTENITHMFNINNDEEIYISYISKRAFNKQKTIFKMNMITYGLLYNEIVENKKPNKNVVYFMESLTFKNLILIKKLNKIYDKLKLLNRKIKIDDNLWLNYHEYLLNDSIPFDDKIKQLNELDENDGELFCNIIKEIYPLISTNMFIDEIPLQISNLETTSEYLTHNNKAKINSMDTNINKENDILLYNHTYSTNNKFKSESILNIYGTFFKEIKNFITKFNNITEIVSDKKMKHNSKTNIFIDKLQKEKLTKLYDLQNLFNHINKLSEKPNLNILLTLFKQTTTTTAEMLPFQLLTFYGFKPCLPIKYNKTEIIDKIININNEIKEKDFTKMVYNKKESVVNIKIIHNNDIKPCHNNRHIINRYIENQKNQMNFRNELLVIGNRTFNTDISYDKIKGSNDFIVNNSEKYNSEKQFELNTPETKKILSIISNDHPSILFIQSKLFIEGLQYMYNNKNDINNDLYEKGSKLYNYIDDNILVHLDTCLSYISHADDINQVIGRYSFFRILFNNLGEIKLPNMEFLIPEYTFNELNFTPLIIKNILQRYKKYIHINMNYEFEDKIISSQNNTNKSLYDNTITYIKNFLGESKNSDLLINTLKKEKWLNPKILKMIYTISKVLSENILSDSKVNNININNSLSYLNKRQYDIDNIKHNEKTFNKKIELLNSFQNNSENYKGKYKRISYKNKNIVFRELYPNFETLKVNNIEIIKNKNKTYNQLFVNDNDNDIINFSENYKINLFISHLSLFRSLYHIPLKYNNMINNISNNIFINSKLYYQEKSLLTFYEKLFDIKIKNYNDIIDTFDVLLNKIDLPFNMINLDYIISLFTKKEDNITTDILLKDMYRFINIPHNILYNIKMNNNDPFKYILNMPPDKLILDKKQISKRFKKNGYSNDKQTINNAFTIFDPYFKTEFQSDCKLFNDNIFTSIINNNDNLNLIHKLTANTDFIYGLMEKNISLIYKPNRYENVGILRLLKIIENEHKSTNNKKITKYKFTDKLNSILQLNRRKSKDSYKLKLYSDICYNWMLNYEKDEFNKLKPFANKNNYEKNTILDSILIPYIDLILDKTYYDSINDFVNNTIIHKI